MLWFGLVTFCHSALAVLVRKVYRQGLVVPWGCQIEWHACSNSKLYALMCELLSGSAGPFPLPQSLHNSRQADLMAELKSISMVFRKSWVQRSFHV